MYISLHVKWPLFLQSVMKPEAPWQIFEKYSNNIHENRPIEGELFHADGQNDRQTEKQT